MVLNNHSEQKVEDTFMSTKEHNKMFKCMI